MLKKMMIGSLCFALCFVVYLNVGLKPVSAALGVPLQFDFGTSTNVASGFTPVTETTAYNSSLQYGWASTAGLDCRDRGTPDALKADFVLNASGATNTFNIDIANGTYNVRVIIGDSAAAQLPMNVLAEGATKISGLSLSANEFADRTFSVTVSDGQLNLGFNAVTAGDTWRINAVELLPKFDFGTATNVASGYTPVTEATAYSSTLHYGWASTTGLDYRDRGSPDALKADFVFNDTGNTNTFNVDLANGTYTVRVIIGDYAAAQVPMDVLAEGVVKISGLTTSGANVYADQTFSIGVSDGQLNLGFRGTSAGNTWRINAVEITPSPELSNALATADEYTDGSTLDYLDRVSMSVVHHASDSTWTYSHNPAIAKINNTLVVGWINGEKNEDFSEPMRAVYKYSTDNGVTWSSLGIIADDPDGTGSAYRGFNGFWLRGSSLYALIEHSNFDGAKATGRADGQSEHLYLWNDSTKTFSDAGQLIENFIPHAGPKQLANGQWILNGTNVDYVKQNLVGGDSSISAWSRYTQSTPADSHLMGESSTYQLTDGTLLQFYRDRSWSKREYRSRSFDNGVTWEPPVQTDYPDSTSKQSAGNRSDGRSFIVNNASVNTGRTYIMLAQSPATDGYIFSKPKIIDYNNDNPVYPGDFKDNGVQYPNAVEIDGKLYIVVSKAKEDIRLYVYDDTVSALKKFDFGGTNLGYIGYTPVKQTTAYSAALKYGWASTAGLDYRDRGAPDALKADFVLNDSGAANTFNVDLANGTYNVKVIVGDYAAAQVPMDVLAEGAVKISGLTTSGANVFANQTFSVTVSDGQLNLGFRATTAGDTWRINAIEITP